MIKIAIPNKGQLFEPTVELLTSCGYRLTKTPKSLTCLDPENNIEFYFLRPVDIPIYVAAGILDAGVTGKDLQPKRVLEPTLLYLHYAQSRLCAAVPEGSPCARHSSP
ncbi:MAG: ATP phosphoribosyltransferase [Dehalococcoidia bacterium]